MRRRFDIVMMLAPVAGLLLFASACGGKDGGNAPLVLEKLSVHDPGAGMTAFTILLPEGWKHEGGIVWRPHLSNQAAVSFRAWNPTGTEVFELLPCDPFTWRQGGITMFPQGTVYLGNEVQPPISDPAAYVMNVVIPRYRSELENARVVANTPLPDVAAATAEARAEPGARKQAYAARVRVAYDHGDIAMLEDFTCVLLVTQVAMMPGMVLWGPDSLYSSKAEAGSLDAAEPMFHAMATSVDLTPEWFNAYVQVVQMWQQNQMRAIADAGRISRIISQTNDEISDMVRSVYENRQASQDRIHREYGEYIKGVETYQDPYRSRPVELPSGYRQAWGSDNGDYMMSDSTGYNPNVGDTRNWKRLKTVP